MILEGEKVKSDETLIKYAKRYARVQFEMSLLQADYERRMSEYRAKLARVDSLVLDCRPEFIAILGRISSAEIEAENVESE